MSDTTLLTSIVEKRENGMVSFSTGGEPHAAAIVNAVRGNYHRLTGRDKVHADQLEQLIGQKVTLIRSVSGTFGHSAIDALEGSIFPTSRETGVGILPKGKRKNGYWVDPATVLDVLHGYDFHGARHLVEQARAEYPQLRPLTRERLAELPRSSKTVSLALFGTYQTPEGESTDTIILASEYWPDDDIVDGGGIVIRPQLGISEHGSFYGQVLLNRPNALGEIVDFPTLSFKEAVQLFDLDYDEAAAIVFGKVVAS